MSAGRIVRPFAEGFIRSFHWKSLVLRLSWRAADSRREVTLPLCDPDGPGSNSIQALKGPSRAES